MCLLKLQSYWLYYKINSWILLEKDNISHLSLHRGKQILLHLCFGLKRKASTKYDCINLEILHRYVHVYT